MLVATQRAFVNVQDNIYWSSSSIAGNPSFAWGVGLLSGGVNGTEKANTFPVWPVRGGQ